MPAGEFQPLALEAQLQFVTLLRQPIVAALASRLQRIVKQKPLSSVQRASQPILRKAREEVVEASIGAPYRIHWRQLGIRLHPYHRFQELVDERVRCVVAQCGCVVDIRKLQRCGSALPQQRQDCEDAADGPEISVVGPFVAPQQLQCVPEDSDSLLVPSLQEPYPCQPQHPGGSSLWQPPHQPRDYRPVAAENRIVQHRADGHGLCILGQGVETLREVVDRAQGEHRRRQ